MEQESEDFEKIKKDFKNFKGSLDWQVYLEIRSSCGCHTCDCDALSQDSYHKGCHTYGLFDQEGDPTNSTESGGMDESGPKYLKKIFPLRKKKLIIILFVFSKFRL